MRVEELDYEHPPEAVAQRPALERDRARLLVVPAVGPLRHEVLAGVAEHFGDDDVLVVNDTRVMGARVVGSKESGGRVELLVQGCRGRNSQRDWLVLARSSRSPRVGTRILLEDGPSLEVVGRERELFVLRGAGLDAYLAAHGRVPLPPYIEREPDQQDARRYQTSYARARAEWGTAQASCAAPTAGLHFTDETMAAVRAAGARVVRLSLGVGAGTFRPVQTPRVEDHRMHEEPMEISREAAAELERARRAGARVTAVGTTCLRALEAAATPLGRVRPLRAATGLFVLPGTPLRVVDRLVTNFHQPRTTLLALVQAFAGRDRIAAAYREAIAAGYRLFSYGDAMLLERAAP